MTAKKTQSASAAPVAPSAPPKSKYTNEYVSRIMGDLENAVAVVKDAAAYFAGESEAANMEIEEMYTQLQQALPERNHVVKVVKVRAPRSSNKLTILEAVKSVIKKAGRKGLTRSEVGAKVKESGYETKTDDESFANSCYVSGINKLMQSKEVERIKEEGGESHYRMV